MCISPLLIKNPNAGKKPAPGSPLSLKDCSSQFIRVPCGHCPECIASKQLSLVQRLQMESLNHHLFFCTLTYNDDAMPRLVTSSGYEFRYADKRDLYLMIKRIRKNNLFGRSFRYFAVSERGSLHSRPHFHVIFIVDKFKDDSYNDILNLESLMFSVVLKEWRRKVSGSSRNPVYLPLCTFIRKFKNGKLNTTFDLHYIRQYGNDSGTSVAFYVLKYMLKPSTNESRLRSALKLNLPEDEFNDTWKVIRSRYLFSKDFGSSRDSVVCSYIKSCVSKSIELNEFDFPVYFNPDDGVSFPLSRFYRSKGWLYSFDDASFFYWKHGDSPSVDTIHDDDDSPVEHISRLKRSLSDYEKKLSIIQVPSLFDDSDDLFD